MTKTFFVNEYAKPDGGKEDFKWLVLLSFCFLFFVFLLNFIFSLNFI